MNEEEYSARHKSIHVALGAVIMDSAPENITKLQDVLRVTLEYASAYLHHSPLSIDGLDFLQADLRAVKDCLTFIQRRISKEQENASSTSEAEEVDSQEERRSVPEGRDGASHEQVPVPHLHWEDSEVSYPKHNPETDGCNEARVKIEKPLFYYDLMACYVRPGDYVDIGNVPYLVVVVSLMLENLVELTMDTSETTEDACTVATLVVHNDQVLKIARDTGSRKI